MGQNVHQTRDSLGGIGRSRLRGTLRVAMGVKSNADIFASAGNPWETTALEARREAVERAKLEHVLRTAHKPDSHGVSKPAKRSDPDKPQFTVVTPVVGVPTMKQQREVIAFVRDKLADAGLPDPVRVDKQKLAEEKKKEREPMSCRSVQRNTLVAALAKAKRLAQLDKELRANETVKAKCSKFHSNHGHFTRVIEPIKEQERAEIWETAQRRSITYLTVLYLFQLKAA